MAAGRWREWDLWLPPGGAVEHILPSCLSLFFVAQAKVHETFVFNSTNLSNSPSFPFDSFPLFLSSFLSFNVIFFPFSHFLSLHFLPFHLLFLSYFLSFCLHSYPFPSFLSSPFIDIPLLYFSLISFLSFSFPALSSPLPSYIFLPLLSISFPISSPLLSSLCLSFLILSHLSFLPFNLCSSPLLFSHFFFPLLFFPFPSFLHFPLPLASSPFLSIGLESFEIAIPAPLLVVPFS